MKISPLSVAPIRTNVYVDGFNLYYGCLKNTPHKWLNLAEFCRLSLPDHYHVRRIRYFTALVRARPSNSLQDARQQTYIRAIQTLPALSVHYGEFLQSDIRMPLTNPPASGPRTALVTKTEEKGSDVNLATYLLETPMSTTSRRRLSSPTIQISRCPFPLCARAYIITSPF